MPEASDPKAEEPNPQSGDQPDDEKTKRKGAESQHPEHPTWIDFARAEGFDLGGYGQGKTPPPVLTLEDMLAGLFGRAVLAVILFTAFIAGCWVAGTALHDPDTCWLLALGREIIERGIPTSDPFSFTFAAQEAAGKHFILYQWLTETVFYLTHMAGGLLSLLLLCAVIVVTAFLSLPLGIAVRRQSPFLLSCFVVLLGMMAASFHTLARPEIFSYLFLAIFLQLLHHSRAASLTEEGKIFPLVFVIAPVMVLWANMHTGFIAGLAIVAACLLGTTIARVLLRAPVGPLFTVLLQAMVGALIATLITPYGLSLWQYIPSLFYSGINKYIIELAPLGLNSIQQPVYFPFFALIAFWVLSLLGAASWALSKPQGERPKLLSELIISLLVGSIAISYGFHASRLISFVSLMIVAEILALLGLKHLLAGGLESTAKEAKPGLHSLLRKLDLHALDLWKTGGSGELAIVSFCAVAGVFLIAHRVVKPELPASTVAFHCPDGALAFIEANRKKENINKIPALQGKLFNDPQFGDVLIWRQPRDPKVFIDTRFDMYGAKFVADYMNIVDNHLDVLSELDKLEISWVFVKADAPLAKALLQAPARWTKVFADDRAVIFTRGGS